jgi:hypothetical protein
MPSLAERKRYARLVGYLIGVLAGVVKLLPITGHLTPEVLGHTIGVMLVVGGLLGAWAQFKRNVSIEIAGLWLLTGALGIFAVGVWAASGDTHFDIALIFLAASFLFLGRTLELFALGHRVEQWRKRHANH